MNNLQPHFFFRVYDAGSHCNFDEQNGFQATDQGPIASHLRKPIAIEHMAGTTNRTPYVSMFSDAAIARRYAREEVERGRVNIRVAKIDGQMLRRSQEIDQISLMGITFDTMITDYFYDEWLCLHHIPRTAILQLFTVEEFERERYNQSA